MPTTIPQFARTEDIALDRLRRLLRKRSDISGLTEHIGPTRVIPAERIDEFRTAVRQAIGGA